MTYPKIYHRIDSLACTFIKFKHPVMLIQALKIVIADSGLLSFKLLNSLCMRERTSYQLNMDAKNFSRYLNKVIAVVKRTP